MRYEFIGWLHDAASNADKVWGVILLQKNVNNDLDRASWAHDNRYVTFWGRRGKKLQTKISTEGPWGMSQKIKSKLDKGYEHIDEPKFGDVYPEFETDLRKTAVWALLKL